MKQQRNNRHPIAIHFFVALLTALTLILGMVGQAHSHTIVSKTNLTPNITVGGIATYQITVGSAGQSADSIFLRVVDTLPQGFAYRSTQSIQFFNTSRLTTTAPTTPIFPSVGDTSPTWGRFDNPGATGAYFVITFDADVINPVCSNAVTNTAIVPNDPAPTNQHAVLTPAINQAPLNITGPSANLTVTKTTSTPVVINTGAAGMQAIYTITVSNSVSRCAATGVSIADVLPAGFTYASTGAITFTGSPASAGRIGGTNPTVGATNPAWTGFTVPGGGSVTLTFTADIAAGTLNGTYFNSTNAIPAEPGAIVNNFGPGAPVTLAAASLTKIFGAANPASTQVGVAIPLTFTVTKLAGGALSGVAFTDNLPAGLTVSGVPATPQCGGTVSGAGATITVTGASLAAPATTCTITVNVVSATSGIYTNNSSNISATAPGTLITSAVNATLNISNAALTKAFLTPTVGVNGTSVLRFTLTNATAGAAHGGLGFTDTLPANVSVVAGFTVSQCNGGTVTSSGAQNITLSGASLAAGSTSCNVDVTVRGALPGSYVNNTSNISGLAGGLTATGVNATLVVRGAILEKNFSPASIGVGSTSILTFVLTNGAGNPAQTGLAFTETLPTNVTLSAVPVTPQCGGAVTGAIGGSTITFSGGSLALGISACSISATVTSTVTGTYINDSSRITGASSGMDTTGVNATLTAANVVLTKLFASSPVNANAVVVLTFRFTNSAGNPAQTGLAFTDTFPLGVQLFNSTGTFSAGCSGTVTDLGGGTLTANDTGIIVTAGAMAAGTATCTLTVNAKGTAGGTYINNSTNISAASANLGTSGVNATLLVNGATLLVTKTTSTPTVDIIGAASGLATYTVTVQNTGFATAAGVQLTDTLPSAFTYLSTGAITLNGAATRTSVADPVAASATPVWGAFSIPAGDSIAITFSATIPNAQANGTYSNSASVTSTTAGTVFQNFNGASSTAEDVTVQRLADLTITKAQVTANPVLQGQTGVQYSLTVSNIGGAAKLAGNTVTVTEIPPTGLTITALSGTNWTCTLATLTCTRTDALAATASYELINVTATVAANAPITLVNSSTVTLAGQTESNTNNNDGDAPPTTVNSIPNLSKAFATSPVGVGQSSALIFTITNGLNNPAQSGLGFTDTLPANMVIVTPAGVVNTCGGSVTATANTGVITLSGGLLIAGAASCTLTVQVRGNLPGSYVNSTANGNISALAGGLTATGLTATLDVRGTTLTKAFNPVLIVPGQSSVLTFTLTNGVGNPAQTGLAFVDTLSAGLTVVGPITTPQCGGTVSSPSASNITFASGALALNTASCTITVNDSARISGASAGMGISGVNATLTIQSVVATGRVFLDRTVGGAGGDNDGILNGSEQGLANVQMALIDCTTIPNGPVLATATTNGTGQYTLIIPNLGLVSGASRLCVVETNPSGYLSTGASQQTTALSSNGAVTYVRATDTISFIFTTGGDFSGLNFGDVPVNNFTTDGSQSGLPGAVLFYAHTFTAGSAGNVSFSTSNLASPAIAGWSHSIYRDSNCNAVLDGVEGASPFSSTGVTGGQAICTIVKESIPAGAPVGARDVITVSATLTYSGASPALALTLTRADTTTVGTGLSLVKAVDKASALPGEILTYTITYSNNSSGALNNVVISDSTPAFTAYVGASAGCPLVVVRTSCTVTSEPANNATGTIQWNITGSLSPGVSATVQFRVQVQQ
jgi:uncharacterized repeat protein (TIGR01451 family)